MRAIEQIVAMPEAADVYKLLTARKQRFAVSLEIAHQQWEPEQHRIFDKNFRKDKIINVPTGQTDPITGKPIYKNQKVKVCRIAIPFQKSIVNLTVGFLLMNAVTYKATAHGVDVKKMNDKQQKLFDAINHCYHDNKMKYFDKRLARILFKECECAELWYMPTDAEGKLRNEIRVQLLAPSLGDKIYPHFNDYHIMDGFAREYYITDELGMQELHFDVYTNLFCYQYINDKGGGWKLLKAAKHGFTKVPVVYYRQDKPEWADVQWAIERVETCVSNWGDTNDYFGTPKYYVKGRLEGFAEKGEQGTVFQGGEQSDMQVLSWDKSPESVKGEIAYLFNIIYSFTSTADISFENMKTLGSNTSGAAIRLMFTAPYMKADLKTEMFGEMFTRRSNIVANGICNTGVYVKGIDQNVAEQIDFEPVFKPYLPKNDVEMLELITSSNGGAKSTSNRRAIELNPLNDDPDKIEEEIKEEQQEALAQQAALSGLGSAASGEQSVSNKEEEEE